LHFCDQILDILDELRRRRAGAGVELHAAFEALTNGGASRAQDRRRGNDKADRKRASSHQDNSSKQSRTEHVFPAFAPSSAAPTALRCAGSIRCRLLQNMYELQ
jgi:hypothetical protein